MVKIKRIELREKNREKKEEVKKEGSLKKPMKQKKMKLHPISGQRKILEFYQRKISKEAKPPTPPNNQNQNQGARNGPLSGVHVHCASILPSKEGTDPHPEVCGGEGVR